MGIQRAWCQEAVDLGSQKAPGRLAVGRGKACRYNRIRQTHIRPRVKTYSHHAFAQREQILRCIGRRRSGCCTTRAKEEATRKEGMRKGSTIPLQRLRSRSRQRPISRIRSLEVGRRGNGRMHRVRGMWGWHRVAVRAWRKSLIWAFYLDVCWRCSDEAFVEWP